MATRSVPQPPFSVDVLADLHAGNLEPEVREQLWPAVNRDPDALRVLRALDEVSTRIRALGAEERVLHAMPVDIAARLERFVTDLDGVEPTEQLGQRPVPARPEPPADDVEATTRLGPGDGPGEGYGDGEATARLGGTDDSADPGSRRTGTVVPLAPRRRRPAYLLTAAAAVLLVLAVGVGITAAMRAGTEPGTPTAQPPAALDVGDELTSTAALGIMGRNDVTGPLGSAAALRRCVAANGLERPVLGSTDVLFRGGPAVLVLLAGPRSPGVTALVVGTGCSTGDPQQLTRTDIG
ncbi:hypothetical protein [Nocardia asteroides]|uniref:hypothetical protein n=1 Tax=Nocardia asteroides TaxID=1824 RepID=UPI001E3860BD|nr:hypothetical protein [Nocardia asteroides]UGT59271.1 hypothetical protein LTT61_18505 [Nocardia asteroides]